MRRPSITFPALPEDFQLALLAEKVSDHVVFEGIVAVVIPETFPVTQIHRFQTGYTCFDLSGSPCPAEGIDSVGDCPADPTVDRKSARAPYRIGAKNGQNQIRSGADPPAFQGPIEVFVL